MFTKKGAIEVQIKGTDWGQVEGMGEGWGGQGAKWGRQVGGTGGQVGRGTGGGKGEGRQVGGTGGQVVRGDRWVLVGRMLTLPTHR